MLTALWALFTRMAAAGGGWRLCRSAGGVLARGGRRRAEECTLQDFLAQIALSPLLTSPEGDAFRARYAPRGFFDTPFARSPHLTVEADPLSQKNGRKNRKKS